MIITEESLMEVAAKLLDFPKSRKWKEETEQKKFRHFFGCSACVAVIIWNKIEGNLKNRALPKHLLWSLIFIKHYGSEEVCCRIVGWPDRKTYREWVWYMLEQIGTLKKETIDLENRFTGVDFKNPPKTNCYMSIDATTDCPINEPMPFDKKWYSQKINGPGVKYEVGVCIITGHIIWINGPFPASENDGTIMSETLAPLLCEDEAVEVDGGYSGNPRMKGPTVAKASIERKQKSLVRGRHEIVNSRLKIYNVLNISFRHTGKYDERSEELLRKHGICFIAIAVITQIGFTTGEAIFDVDYDVEYW
jgi:hypothetical protein